MGETGEAPTPVDLGQPSEVNAGGPLESSEATAADCYNARSVMGATEVSAAEQSGNEAAVAGKADGENGGAASSKAWEKPDDGEASSMESFTDLSGGEPAGIEEGDAVPSSEQTTDSSEPPSDSEPERGEPQAPGEAEGASDSLPEEDLEETQDPDHSHEEKSLSPRGKADSEAEAEPALNDKTSRESKPPEARDQDQGAYKDPLHKLKYDKEAENKLARKRMLNPHYLLPTDFSKYFDIRTGQGPKQPLESSLTRGRRRFAEMKAWRKKVEEQSPLVYNRKVGKSRQ